MTYIRTTSHPEFSWIEFAPDRFHRGAFISTDTMDEAFYAAASREEEAFRGMFQFRREVVAMSRHSVSGIELQHYSPEIIIDLDSSENVLFAKLGAQQIVSYLLTHGLRAGNIGVFFSGGKGFHIHFPTDYILGLEPSLTFCKDVRGVVQNLSEQAGLGYLARFIDLSVYQATRLIRCEGGRHSSGRYKTQLRPSDLTSAYIERIYEMSAEYRPLIPAKPYEVQAQSNPDVEGIVSKPRPRLPVGAGKYAQGGVRGFVGMECLRRMKDAENVPHGMRDEVALRLICHSLNVEGNTIDMTKELMKAWRRPIHDNTKLTTRSLNAKIDRCPTYSYTCYDPIFEHFCDEDCPLRRTLDKRTP